MRALGPAMARECAPRPRHGTTTATSRPQPTATRRTTTRRKNGGRRGGEAHPKALEKPSSASVKESMVCSDLEKKMTAATSTAVGASRGPTRDLRRENG